MVPEVLHAAVGKYIFSNANISSHQQDIEVLLMVLTFTCALVSLQNFSSNCLQIFVFNIHLNFDYFSTAIFGENRFVAADIRRNEVFLSFF